MCIRDSFAAVHPRIRVDVRCEPSPLLERLLRDGELDLSILSCEAGKEEGPILQREPVVWIASRDHFPQVEDPVPLALFSPPCLFHDWALKALGAIGRRHRIAYTSSNLSALRAAVASGLAVGAMARSSASKAFYFLRPQDGFPPLPEVSITLAKAARTGTDASNRLADHILRSFEEWPS